MPPTGFEAVLLLLAARLASPRLLSAWAHRPRRGAARGGRMVALHRVHERPAARAVDELRRDRRHLVRRGVGSSRGAAAAGSHLRPDSRAAAPGAPRRQPSPPPPPPPAP